MAVRRPGERSPLNLPAQTPPSFDGLLPPTVSQAFWNPANASFFSTAGTAPDRVFASEGTTGASPFTVPDPDPNELFPHFSFQIFGTQTPTENQPPTMLGFLVDYLIATGNDLNTAERIMESYSPGQVPVLGQLARNYAVCDRWFGSVSAQTWPNRGFMHTGTSRGQVTNSSPFAYNTETIFDVLQKTGKSWRIYKDTLTRKPSSRGKANKIRYFGERGGAPAFVQAFLPLGDRRATRWDKSREASFFIPDE